MPGPGMPSEGNPFADDPQLSKAIKLEWNYIFCPRHGEPFRKPWRVSLAVITSVEAFQRIMALDETHAEMRARSKQDKPDLEDPVVRDHLYAMLTYKPICDRLSKDDLLELYYAIWQKFEAMKDKEPTVENPFPRARCVACSKEAIGQEYRVTMPRSAEPSFPEVTIQKSMGNHIWVYPHLCFGCVVYNFTDSRGRPI